MGYIFDMSKNLTPKERHSNLRESLSIINHSITNAIRDLLPIRDILKQGLLDERSNDLENTNDKNIDNLNENDISFQEKENNDIDDNEDNDEDNNDDENNDEENYEDNN